MKEPLPPGSGFLQNVQIRCADDLSQEQLWTGKKTAEYFLIIFVDFLEKTRIISFCMDTKKDTKIPECGNLPDLAKFNTVVGAKQLRKALTKGIAKAVYLAENADPALTEPIAQLCASLAVSCIWVPSMTDLGRACGIEVGAAAAAIVS